MLLGNGDGTFHAAVTYGSGGEFAKSVVVADVNGDGKSDLAVANQCAINSSTCNGALGVLLGNGDGTFQPAASYASGGEYAFSVAVGDVNTDGRPDLVVTNLCAISNSNCGGGMSSNGTVGVLVGNGDGTFQPVVVYDSGGQLAYRLVIGDVNGDRKGDLLIANFCASNISNCGQVGTALVKTA